MNKVKTAAKWFHKVVISYLLYGAPLFIPYCAWILLSKAQPPESGILGFINVLSFIWVWSILYFFLSLVFYSGFRETLMGRIAGFKERDEREELATAKAARHTFLLMLAIQTVLLVLSLTTIRLEKYPEGGKLLTVGMGLSSSQHLNLSGAQAQDPALYPTVGSKPEDLEISRWVLPPNFFTVLALLIVIQLVSFRFFSRRAYRGF